MPQTTVKRPFQRVVAIETGSPRGSVAAAHGGRAIHRPLGDDGQHGRLVTAALEEAAAAAGFRPDTADLVVVVRGPGSFTGLRVGVALGKALAWATGAALAGVSGFDLIARRVAPVAGRSVWVAFDAGRGELAVCRVGREPTGRLVGGPAALWDPAALLAAIPAGDHLAGPATERLAALLDTRPDLVIDADPTWPTALEGLRLGEERAAAGDTDDAAAILPEYLRPSYVEAPRRT